MRGLNGMYPCLHYIEEAKRSFRSHIHYGFCMHQWRRFSGHKSISQKNEYNMPVNIPPCVSRHMTSTSENSSASTSPRVDNIPHTNSLPLTHHALNRQNTHSQPRYNGLATQQGGILGICGTSEASQDERSQQEESHMVQFTGIGRAVVQGK